MVRHRLVRPDRRSRHAESERDSLADPCEHDRAPGDDVSLSVRRPRQGAFAICWAYAAVASPSVVAGIWASSLRACSTSKLTVTARREPLGITRLINAASAGSRRTLSWTEARRFLFSAMASLRGAIHRWARIVPYQGLTIFGRELVDVCVKFHAARGRRAAAA